MMSEPFEQLREICLSLKMAKPPDTITVENFMDGIEKKVRNFRFIFVINF